MSKLLLTSICKPIGPRYGDAASVGYELLHGQVTIAQGIFSPRATHLQYGLELIAANLDTPTTVLQYPSKRELIRELKKGYEYVGLSFVLSTYHRMKEVTALIRQYSPNSKIVLGGYGTVIEDTMLTPYCDAICRSEGVDFMKEYLGEAPRIGAYRHPVIISKLRVLSSPAGNTGMVFAGLGCPNGCDFCCTSYFFRRRHIRLLDTGKEIFNVIAGYQDLDEETKITILDEDFLLNAKRAREFAEHVKITGRTFSIFCFASLRALAQFSVEEIVAMGIDGLWIGFEGKRSGYAKLGKTDVPKLFADLRSAGILILASMIIGFDYQTPDIVQEELDYLIEQKPTLTQILIYGPTPGTPFYERILAEGRLRPDLLKDREKYFHQCTGFDAMVGHPTLSSDELCILQQRCFRDEFEKLGPSVVRALEYNFLGYQRWKNHPNPALRNKAMAFGRYLLKGLPILPVAGILGPSRQARRAAWILLGEVRKQLPIPVMRMTILSCLAFPAAMWTWFKLKTNLFQHPRLRRTVYGGKIDVSQTKSVGLCDDFLAPVRRVQET